MRVVLGGLTTAIALIAVSLSSAPASADSASQEMRSTEGLTGSVQAQQPAGDQTATTPTARPRHASRKAVRH